MNFLKNIIFFSYIKNKGIRRICYIVSFFIFVWFMYISITEDQIYKGIDNLYPNFQSFNSDVYHSSRNRNRTESKRKYRKKIYDCASSYMKKKGFPIFVVNVMSSNEDIIGKGISCHLDFYNSYYNNSFDDCNRLKEIKGKPVHLKCGPFETYEHSNAEGALIWLIKLLLFTYFPFIVCVATDVAYKLLKVVVMWIYQGFKESSKQ